MRVFYDFGTAETSVKVRVIALVACLAAADAAHACIWSYGTSLRGEEELVIDGLAGDDVVEQLGAPRHPGFWEAQERKHAARARTDPNHEVRNDHAVTLMHLGRTRRPWHCSSRSSASVPERT